LEIVVGYLRSKIHTSFWDRWRQMHAHVHACGRHKLRNVHREYPVPRPPLRYSVKWQNLNLFAVDVSSHGWGVGKGDVRGRVADGSDKDNRRPGVDDRDGVCLSPRARHPPLHVGRPHINVVELRAIVQRPEICYVLQHSILAIVKAHTRPTHIGWVRIPARAPKIVDPRQVVPCT